MHNEEINEKSEEQNFSHHHVGMLWYIVMFMSLHAHSLFVRIMIEQHIYTSELTIHKLNSLDIITQRVLFYSMFNFEAALIIDHNLMKVQFTTVSLTKTQK